MENIKNISKALVNAQAEMSNAKKDSLNPFFKSKYADLNSVREAILPILNKHGISVLQPTKNIDGKNFIRTILLHETGESIESDTEIIYSKQNDAQSQGSGITYARRYGLQSFVCLGADDDDGNSSSKKPTKLDIQDENVLKYIDSFDNIDQFIEFRSKYALTISQKELMTKKFNELFPNYKK
jgi:hypothetical protein